MQTDFSFPVQFLPYTSWSKSWQIAGKILLPSLFTKIFKRGKQILILFKYFQNHCRTNLYHPFLASFSKDLVCCLFQINSIKSQLTQFRNPDFGSKQKLYYCDFPYTYNFPYSVIRSQFIKNFSNVFISFPFITIEKTLGSLKS